MSTTALRRPDVAHILDMVHRGYNFAAEERELCDYIELLEDVARAANALHFYADDYDENKVVDTELAAALIAALSKLPELPPLPVLPEVGK